MEAVRVATAADVPRLSELVTESMAASVVARAASLFRHPHRIDLVDVRLQRALEANDRQLFAGTIDDYVIGVALVTIDPSAAHGAVGVIEELYVEPEARQVGVGESLLDACVEWCRQHSCVGVDIAALPGDRNAKNLCENNGFLARTLIMHRNLQ